MKIQRIPNTDLYNYEELVALASIVKNKSPIKCNKECKSCVYRRVCFDLELISEQVDREIRKRIGF